MSQKKRKSVNVVSALSFWILDSDSWIPPFMLASAFLILPFACKIGCHYGFT
ncbi:MAG: hypothetical protein QOH63_72 [Acidobacteriota bacterium]|jgi:hypothetical protein|nr:hypothetical protein [Acidobacteriota bacterium]